MLYLDVALPIKTFKSKPGFPACGVVIGRRQKHRKFDYILGLPRTFASERLLQPRFYSDLTICRDTNKGFLHIEHQRDDKIFLILSSRLTDDPGFVGNIRVPRRQSTKVIGRAVAPPDTGRWETLIIEADLGASFYVNWNTPEGTNGVNAFYQVGINTVHSCTRSGIAGLYHDIGVKPRFTIRDAADQRLSRLVMSEWRKL